MRAVLPLLLAISVPAALSAQAAPAAPAFVAFDAAIERTKKSMMGDPQSALASARAAVAMADRLPDSPRTHRDRITAQWLLGEALIFMNDFAAATPVIDGALARAERILPGTKLHGDLLRARAATAFGRGQVMSALRDYQAAHDVFKRAGEPRSRALTLQDIGTLYWEAGDFERTLNYYRQALDTYDGDPSLTLTMHNNLAEVYRKQKRYEEAGNSFRAALVEAKRIDSPLLQVRILTNLAGSEAEAGRLKSAADAADRAMVLVRHGDAAGWRPFTYGAAARVAAGNGDMRRAASLLDRAFKGVDLERTEPLYSEYHQTAARVYEKLGDLSAALAHAKAVQRLEHEAQKLVASNASQLMAAQFDFNNQNLQIAKLKQDQLARDVAAEREKSKTRTILFSGLLVAGALVFGVLLFGFLTVRRSRDAVSAANGSLRQVNGELEKALKVKTEFLATTSHEIRTPLNGILGMTQVLLADREVDARVRERIEVVHGAGETMKALVDDILDVAKMESGELTVAHEPCDLDHILDDAARLWSGQAQAKGLELVLERDGAPGRILSDGGRLRQIVFNLMSNALKFTSAGRVTLYAGAEPGADGVETLVLRVIDTGIGVPLEKQAEIFEAFKQVDSGVTRQYGGTGLGLAICKQLVAALGGHMRVESVVGRGSTFTAVLPLERVEIEPTTSDEPEPDRTLASARMLLLDRNPLNQGVMRVLLAAEAESVATAESVAEAVEALERDGITHLVVDAGSVAQEGTDLLAGLRDAVHAARGAGAHCTLLLAPAAAGISVAEAMTAGASQLIVKPIGAADLMAALRSLYGEEPEMLVAPSLLDARAA